MSGFGQSRPGRSAPARSRTDRASWAEYQRLRTAGVNPAVAAVLATGRPPRLDDERAYWRQLARGTPTTPKPVPPNATADER